MPGYATNRKAFFNYDFRESYEAGLSLLGWETKSVREGKINLAGSYGIVRGGEIWLVNAEISPYQKSNTPEDADTSRPRRLLLKKEEIRNISRKMESERLSLIPLEIYPKRRTIKIKLALGVPRKKSDKREAVKKKDISREIGKRVK